MRIDSFILFLMLGGGNQSFISKLVADVDFS